MPRLVNLNKMPSRKRRPTRSELPPWEPGKSGHRILELLLEYRYLTSELLGMLYEHYYGQGRYQVRKHLTKLWRYGYCERFNRPVDWGSSQYVYSVSVEGARLVVSPRDWSDDRRKIYNLAKEKTEYEHALATSLVQLLWDLGAESQDELFTTISTWQDKEGTKRAVTNEFLARVGGKDVKIQPDLTFLIAHRRRDYYRPYFFEIERSHKNHERLRRRFFAYGHLLSQSGEQAVGEVYQRAFGVTPERGMAIFIGADRRHAESLRAVAQSVVKRSTEIWFTSLDQLLEERERKRQDGQPCRGRDGQPLVEEVPIMPEDFFERDLLVNLSGKPGRLVV